MDWPLDYQSRVANILTRKTQLCRAGCAEGVWEPVCLY